MCIIIIIDSIPLLSILQPQEIETRHFVYVCNSDERRVTLGVLYGYKAVLQVHTLYMDGKNMCMHNYYRTLTKIRRKTTISNYIAIARIPTLLSGASYHHKS